MYTHRIRFSALIFTVLALLAIGSMAAEKQKQVDANLQCSLGTKSEVACRFDYENQSDLKSIEASINGKPVKASSLVKYPGKSDKTIALVMVDTSDPGRINTVKRNIAVAEGWIKSKASHQRIALGYFDHDLTLARDFDGKAIDLSEAKSGQATEFYKNVISAIELLEKQPGDRKVLIIFSDGKVEDAAYTHAQAVARAKKAGVRIVSLGFAEKPSETPYLQNLEVLAKDSGGKYYQADIKSGQLPLDMMQKPLEFAENGGSFKLALGEVRGKTIIDAVILLQDKQKLRAQATIAIPDSRTKPQKALDYIKQNAIYLGIAVIAFIILVVLIARRRKSKNNKTPEPTYGYLEEMDGLCTKHAIKKKAVRIGRSDQNDIVFRNDSVSIHHAELFLQRNGEFSIVDLNSTNGVFVNDAKVAQAVLNNKDVVEIGEVRLRFIDANAF